VTEKPELKYTLLVLADNARMMRVFSDDIMACAPCDLPSQLRSEP
jgi:hypothetical protein